MKNLTKTFLWLLLGLTMTACVKESEISVPDDGSEVDVQFVVGLPDNSIPSTRTLTSGTAASGDENTINDIFVLMFSGTNYTGYAAGTVTSQGASGNGFRNKTFSARLKRSTSSTDTYTFVFIANFDEEKIKALTTGTAKATLIANLTAAESDIHTNTTTGKYLPMWGEHTTAMEVKKGASVTGVNLLRMVASIDVKITASNYRIKTAYLYNRNTNGRIAPASHSGYVVSTPTIPSPSGFTTGSVRTNKSYATGSGVANYTGEIYTFESKYDDNKHCLVVELEKNDGGWSSCGHYRLDFNDGSKDLDLLRNHKYTFTISEVLSDGDSTHGGAYTNASTGVVATVVQWNTGLGSTTVVGTEGYHLSVSQTQFEFAGEANTAPSDAASLLQILTDNPAGWTAAWYATEANALNQTSAITTPFKLVNAGGSTDSNSGSGNGVRFRYIYRPANTGSSRTQYLRINAGELSVIVKVTQSNVSALTVTPATATAQPVGGEIAASVTAHSGWTATSNLAEATLSPSFGGSGTTPVKLNIPANTGSSQRTITFTFTSVDGTSTKTVVVTQPAITISATWTWGALVTTGGTSYQGMTSAITVNSSGGTWVPLITVNGTEYEGNTSYFSVASGSGNNTIMLTIPPMDNGQMTDNIFSNIRIRDVATGKTSAALSSVTQYSPGVRAAPNIISIDNTGTVRLDGVGWVVYFRWGSNFAITGRATGSTEFSAGELAWGPNWSNWNDLRTNIIGSKTGSTAWALVPYIDDNATTEVGEYNRNSYYGDICGYFGSFKMPGAALNRFNGHAWDQYTVKSKTENHGNYGVMGLLVETDNNQFYPNAGYLAAHAGQLIDDQHQDYGGIFVYTGTKGTIEPTNYVHGLRYTPLLGIVHNQKQGPGSGCMVRCIPK